MIWILLIGLTEAFVVPRRGNSHAGKSIATAFVPTLQDDAGLFGRVDRDSFSKRVSQRPRDFRRNMSESALNDNFDENENENENKLLDQVILTNGVIVSAFAAAAVYQLFHVDAEAIAALFQYGMGPHPPDMTQFSIAADLLARLPMDLLHSYEALVPTNPVFYKACTSGVAYGLGDFISQIYQGKDFSNFDLPRSMRSGIAGFVGHGPLCHYWLMFMETYLDFDGAWWATGIKVTADLTVWSIFLNASYSMIIGLLQFRNPADVWKDVRATQWPALRSAWRFWPFVHTVSFSHAVPLDLKLLWVDAMEVVWVTILSKIANEDKIARLVSEDKNPAIVETDFGVDPALEIEMSREKEMDNLSFELPKQVLSACWPLIAMWPVLYAGYRLEVMLGLVHNNV